MYLFSILAMKKLSVLLLNFFIPILLVIATYIWLDPFKVIMNYKTYYKPYNEVSLPLDKDYVSTATYDNHYLKEHYDSYIFGNSRSIFYGTKAWNKHIGQDSKPYHFDASNETLFGIYRKILYIDGKGEKIKNVLLIIDRQLLLQTQPNEGHLFIISPQLVKYDNITDFHFTFMKAFFSYKFFPAYIDYKTSGVVKPYMTEDLLDDIPFHYVTATNEMTLDDSEKAIVNGTFYTPQRLKIFYKRSLTQKYSPKCIGEQQKAILNAIVAIFRKHKTDYRIIINPLYNQEKLNSTDTGYLKQRFGTKKVFDFSGINSFTNNYMNYYEASHYRPQVANAILQTAYSK